MPRIAQRQDQPVQTKNRRKPERNPNDPKELELRTLQPFNLTVEAAGFIIGVCRSETYELIKQGKLETFKYGRRRLVPYEAAHRTAIAMREAPEMAGIQDDGLPVLSEA